MLLISNELSTLYTDSAKVKKGARISTHTIIYQLVITKFRNDTLLAVRYVAGAVLLSQLETFVNLVTHNESVHCGISFEIFLPVHSQTKFYFDTNLVSLVALLHRFNFF